MHIARPFVAGILFFVSLPAFCLQSSGNLSVLSVPEPKLQFVMDPQPQLELPLENRSGKTLGGHVHLEIINEEEKIAGSTDVDISIAPGSQTKTIPWAKRNLPSDSPSYLYWHRLSYRITPDAEGGFAPQEGIVQLGRMIPNLFRIMVSGNKRPRRGSNLLLRVRVDDPRTSKGLSGVQVEARLSTDDKSATLPTKSAKTDSQGYAILSVKIPADMNEDEPSVEVTAWRGAWHDTESIALDLKTKLNLTVSTDKPIYQPGQVLHLRTLVLGQDNHAAPGRSLTFTIEDDDNNVEFQQAVKTSSFGIAQADWEIPGKARLGPYTIKVRTEDGDESDRSVVRVSRYELPQFTVHPEADKPYYLPGQNPKVEVTANYLFGKQVTRGKVRVVRTGERRWNSKTQKWESDEQDIQQGQLDSSSKFTASLDISQDFSDLEERDYRRIEDANFAAYVTDLSTNRTEQKRFAIRITKESIHVYVIGAIGGGFNPQGSLDLYVTTSYPDGTPASADVVVSAVKPAADGGFPPAPTLSDCLQLARIHTNRYGVGHLQTHALPQEAIFTASSNSELMLMLEAADGRGKRGAHSEQLWTRWRPYLRIKPVRSLLREGESVLAEIESSLHNERIFVDLMGPDGVLQSQQVSLRHGRAQVEFAYDAEFRNSLMLAAYNMNTGEKKMDLAATAEVLFPGPQELDLGLRLQKATYKPGDPAQAQFRVRAPDGRPARSALGIVIYDKAVAERVRTDEEFGSYGFYRWNYKWNSYSPIAGITYQDLLNRKLTAPVSPDLELLAEAILATGHWWDWSRFLEGADGYRRDPVNIFTKAINATLNGPRDVLTGTYRRTFEFPRSLEQLQKLLLQGGTNFDGLLDPWGMPYRARFLVSGADDVVEFISNGPDKLPGTADDFVARRLGLPYFNPVGGAINWAAQEYVQRTGNYIRDYATLRKEMQSRGVDLDLLKDPWGHSYDFKFEIEGASYVVRVTSAGPDGIFNSTKLWSSDDVNEWTSSTRYFQRETAAISRALAEYIGKTGNFPTNENEFRPVLETAGLSFGSLIDPWGLPYHLEFSTSSRYWDKTNISSYSINGEPQQTTKVIPVTQHLGWIEVKSYGPKHDPADQNIKIASFSEVLSEQDGKGLAAQKESAGQIPFLGGTGAISGTVTDPQGAVIPRAQIKVTNLYLGTVAETTSGEYGQFVLRNLPTGIYKAEISAPGFKVSHLDSIPVTSSNITTVDVQLSVGEASMTVEVAAESALVETSASQSSGSVVNNGPGRVHAEQQAFTPRLRKYFPETLVWQPELVTDSAGRAQLKFLMADNITTWKMSVIGSTIDGQMGMAETELRTFQPFFLEHDPPKILTQGDQIQLPVVLRNYLDKPQEVNVKLDPAPWFSLSGPSEQRIKVPAGQDAVAPFLISAGQSVHEGKQRVTAANHQTGDAVERTVSVHPDGEDITQTVAAVLSGSRAGLEIEVPANAVPGSVEAELKIYPNLSSHVLDAVHGMVLRPGGCGEQITSLAFGSVLALQVLKKAGRDDPQKPGNPNGQLAAQARKYLKQGYDQLVSLQAGNGGFPYWAGHDPDISLTAYVLDFLQQASEFVAVDPALLARARKYLVGAQHPDGGWLFYVHGGQPRPDANATALAVRVLAGENGQKESVAAVDKGMKYLEHRISEWTDPYLVGQYALAAAASGHADYIANAKARLLELAHQEGPGTYWNLEANTSPFYGWGRAGRMETTALVVQALSLLREKNHDDAKLSQYADQGIIFLLHNKDRYGVWYSTQATVNVLKAIIGALPQVNTDPHPAEAAEVLINGQHLSSVRLPATGELSGPLPIDISSALHSGMNHIEIVRQHDGALMQAQIVATHYIRWTDSQATKNIAFKTGESRALRLGVAFDTTETKIGEPVRCTVEAERVGFSGYGMLLAEIGLPPGADVDRASLEEAMSSYDVSRYDVLPDRVVFYLWPRAGGSKFSFIFHPRLGMKAAAAPSTIYDYYNPDSHAVVAPARFDVH